MIKDPAFDKRFPAIDVGETVFAQAKLMFEKSSRLPLKVVSRVGADEMAARVILFRCVKEKLDGSFAVAQFTFLIPIEKVEFAHRPAILLNLQTLFDDLEAAN